MGLNELARERGWAESLRIVARIALACLALRIIVVDAENEFYYVGKGLLPYPQYGPYANILFRTMPFLLGLACVVMRKRSWAWWGFGVSCFYISMLWGAAAEGEPIPDPYLWFISIAGALYCVLAWLAAWGERGPDAASPDSGPDLSPPWRH